MSKQRKPLINEAGEVRELTKKDFARMVPLEQLPDEVKRSLATRRYRGPQKAPTKQRVTIRLSPQIVEYFQASGPGWQTRINQTLQEAITRAKAAHRRIKRAA
jgi:uncharacterized protein (DUF4415 family)